MNRHAGYLIAGALVALGALLTIEPSGLTSTPTPHDTRTLAPGATEPAQATPSTVTATTWPNATPPPSTTHTHTPGSTTPTSTTTPPPASSAKPAAVALEPTPCAEWLSLAASVGWPTEALNRVGYIIHRESRCDPTAYNGADPNGGSRGLTQINGYWCKSTAGWPAGFVQTEAGLDDCDDLFDPEANLSAALAIWRHAGQQGCPWRPWTTRNTRWCP